MKTIVVPALAAALLTFTACEQRTETALPVADTGVTVSERIGEIAGDKTMTADVMRQSYQKGTFDDALAMAIADSALAAEVMEVLRNDPRYAALLKPETPANTLASSTAKTSSKKSSSQSTGARTGSQRSTSGDPLDKAERTMNQANEKLDQANRVRDQIDEARRKAEGIFKK